MNSLRLMLLVVMGSLITLSIRAAADSPGPSDPEKGEEKPFHKDLLKIATDYKSWGRVDDELRWAPGLCRAPKPGRVHVSASKDEQTHGQKLYSLFASKWANYWTLGSGMTADIGQVLVKQSWVPEEITDPKERPGKGIEDGKVIRTPAADVRDKSRQAATDHFYPYVWKGEKVFQAAKQADLFIMMKLDPKTPGTDAGWVYGTVTPDGKKVTSAGRLESCMNCHREAKSDRLFGLWK